LIIAINMTTARRWHARSGGLAADAELVQERVEIDAEPPQQGDEILTR